MGSEDCCFEVCLVELVETSLLRLIWFLGSVLGVGGSFLRTGFVGIAIVETAIVFLLFVTFGDFCIFLDGVTFSLVGGG